MAMAVGWRGHASSVPPFPHLDHKLKLSLIVISNPARTAASAAA
jgi:hypothetical protein